jgi:hypothetical protein
MEPADLAVFLYGVVKEACPQHGLVKARNHVEQGLYPAHSGRLRVFVR